MKLIKQTAILAAAMAGTSFANAQNIQIPTPTKQPTLDGAIRTDAILLPQWPAGFVSKPVEEQANIYKPLASATEAALTDKGFDDMVERLSEPDRQRMKDNFAGQDFPELNKLATQLRGKFKQKYASDFKIDDPMRVFDSRVQVAQAEVSDPNLAKDRFPVRTIDPAQEARMASGRIEPAHPQPKEKSYLSLGRKVAIVSLPGSEMTTIPAMNVSLAHEFLDNWKIDIPDTVTGQQLHDNLIRQLTKLNESSADWPENVNDAKRLFVRHVVAAIYDVPTEPKTRDTADSPTVNQPPELNPNRP